MKKTILIIDKLIFHRGIGILRLESQEGKDVRWLAFELDKCWQKKTEEHK